MRSVFEDARGAAAMAAAVVASLLLFTPALGQPAPDSGAAPAPPPGLSESVVASVNDDVITSYDLVQRMRLLIVTAGIQPTDANIPQLERDALRSLVEEHLELQELGREEKEQKFSIIASDSDIDDEINDIARSNNSTAKQLLASLAAQGVGAETFRAQIRAEISWQRWIRGRYGSRVRIGEDQIKAYQQRAAAASNQSQYQISEVFLDAQRAGGMTQALDGANQLVAQLHQGAPFAAIAKQFSASATAANGGDAGWVTPGEMPTEVAQALAEMRPGTLSAPIQTKDGVYIVYLRDRRAGGGSTMVNLKQAAIALPASAPQDQVDAASAKLEALRAQLHGCDGLEAIAAKTEGVVAGDLGEADLKDLATPFRTAAEGLKVGEVSEPIRTDAGLHLIAVCGKRATGVQNLDHDEIENRLYGQQLSMLSRRYLRDLQNSATIETH